MKNQVAPFIFGGAAAFPGVKMVLAGAAGNQLSALGFFDALGSAFVGFDFGHMWRVCSENYKLFMLRGNNDRKSATHSF